MAKKKEWNYLESDAKSMTPRDKGQILWLKEQGKKPKEIAGITGFSMGWIKLIISTLQSWRNKSDLIDEWLEYQQKVESKGDKYVKRAKSTSKISNSDGNERDTGTDSKGAKQRTQKNRRTRGKNKSKAVVRGRSRSGSNINKTLKDKFKESVDYKGE